MQAGGPHEGPSAGALRPRTAQVPFACSTKAADVEAPNTCGSQHMPHRRTPPWRPSRKHPLHPRTSLRTLLQPQRLVHTRIVVSRMRPRNCWSFWFSLMASCAVADQRSNMAIDPGVGSIT